MLHFFVTEKWWIWPFLANLLALTTHTTAPQCPPTTPHMGANHHQPLWLAGGAWGGFGSLFWGTPGTKFNFGSTPHKNCTKFPTPLQVGTNTHWASMFGLKNAKHMVGLLASGQPRGLGLGGGIKTMARCGSFFANSHLNILPPTHPTNILIMTQQWPNCLQPKLCVFGCMCKPLVLARVPNKKYFCLQT